MTSLLILAWIGVFALEASRTEVQLRQLLETFGLSALAVHGALAATSTDGWSGVGVLLRDAVVPLFTYQFLHGGVMHLVGNVVFFWVFGSRLESRAGSMRFLIFVLGSGVLAGIAQVAMAEGSAAVTIGASGAIAACMAAYMVLYFKSRILLVVPVVVVPLFFEVSAVLLALAWFALQFPQVRGALALGAEDSVSVAWFAHIGGFAAGIVLIPLLARRRRTQREHSEEIQPAAPSV